MLNRVISIVFISFFLISSMLLYIVALGIWLLTVPFDRRLHLLHMFTSFWGSLYLWVMPAWSVSVSGREHIGKKIYIVVSNHQSLLDILVAFRIFFHFKWVSKSEIFNIPFIGWNMRLNRYIRLVRGDKDSVQRMFRDCNEAIARGSSVYIFPEGSRSKTGQLKPFKTGAFSLAWENKLPILPIAISGTRDALPKHSLNFHGKHQIRVKVLEEIPYEAFENITPEETAAMVRARIVKNLDMS